MVLTPPQGGQSSTSGWKAGPMPVAQGNSQHRPRRSRGPAERVRAGDTGPGSKASDAKPVHARRRHPQPRGQRVLEVVPSPTRPGRGRFRGIVRLGDDRVQVDVEPWAEAFQALDRAGVARRPMPIEVVDVGVRVHANHDAVVRIYAELTGSTRGDATRERGSGGIRS
jgi:hypothetical protein